MRKKSLKIVWALWMGLCRRRPRETYIDKARVSMIKMIAVIKPTGLREHLCMVSLSLKMSTAAMTRRFAWPDRGFQFKANSLEVVNRKSRNTVMIYMKVSRPGYDLCIVSGLLLQLMGFNEYFSSVQVQLHLSTS